jgi:hypothetical protein
VTEDDRAKIEALAERIRMAGGWVSDAGYTDSASLCLYFAIAERTFRDWRARDFPAGYQFGRLLFDLADVADWIAERKSTGGDRRIAAGSGEW